MNEINWDRLLEIQRCGISERIIFGAVAVATSQKSLQNIGGDPMIFGRSLMKPFQMKAIQKELNDVLDWPEKAIALASHNGEPKQIQTAQRILAPEQWKLLKLPPSAPMNGSTSQKSIWSNPCSGKHSAILRACQLNGWPNENYLDETHPYNQRYRKLIESSLQVNLSSRIFAPDGCSLPTFTLPLSELAKLYASLAKFKAEDWIWEAHHRHPELIGGSDRLDSKLLASPHLLAKEGADGLLGLSLIDAKYPDGLGIVVKLAHGYDMKMMQIIAHEILHLTDTTEFSGQTVLCNRALGRLL